MRREVRAMTFESILFRPGDPRPNHELATPDFFVDLNLDQIVATVATGRGEYRLTPFFHAPLNDVDAVAFRHEVMRDLEHGAVFDCIGEFARGMRAVREHVSELAKRYHERQKDRWFLDAVSLYGAAVQRLARDLSAERLSSRGLLAFRDHLVRYTSSARFIAVIDEGKRLDAALSAIRYTVLTHELRVEVRRHAGEADYSAEIAATFERFWQGDVEGHHFPFPAALEMNHVESRILDGVAHLFSETFSQLANYRAVNADFQDPLVAAFDREIQFYIAYLEYITRLRAAGLAFCYPRVTVSEKQIYDHQGFDLALAGKLISHSAIPVCNDFYLGGPERIIVVSGPNQGGKTTFARMFGQLHYLASLGLPVPGAEAQLYLPDGIFVHFDREERMADLRGKLEDDLVRMQAILKAATPQSIIVINEIFASTALRDAVLLSERIAHAIMQLDALCVWVTFVEEVASLGEKTVSMVSTVSPENPVIRTLKIVRRSADGLAYAMAVAQKHGLTYQRIKERLGR
jgi:DNA mismatch repair protein MutS